MRRRDFITLLSGAAAAWPLPARAQLPAMPVVGFVNVGSADVSTLFKAAFRKGLGETGYVEGQKVTVEYHWLDGQYDRLPALMADLVRRRVAVITAPGNNVAALLPRPRRRRSRSSLVLATTRSSLVLSLVSPDQAAI
jgi:putative tryptophan/tyrosine transport system substrate-binding protein